MSQVAVSLAHWVLFLGVMSVGLGIIAYEGHWAMRTVWELVFGAFLIAFLVLLALEHGG